MQHTTRVPDHRCEGLSVLVEHREFDPVRNDLFTDRNIAGILHGTTSAAWHTTPATPAGTVERGLSTAVAVETVATPICIMYIFSKSEIDAEVLIGNVHSIDFAATSPLTC
jgi:hypothetical protein